MNWRWQKLGCCNLLNTRFVGNVFLGNAYGRKFSNPNRVGHMHIDTCIFKYRFFKVVEICFQKYDGLTAGY